KSVDDLADKNVAVQSGSNGPAILEEFAPKASQQEFKPDEEARQALQQGRVDAYVIDNNMQQSALVREPGKYKIAGKP
ncbi:substrate-binding periplasmic protein, partial [Bacteroides thetaiotaomicron]|uniref:substrate-binding periplasmic protein n=1 Tax=Bacteroides thetaiotaomicron TaxID=818 RepID=UPI001D075D0F